MSTCQPVDLSTYQPAQPTGLFMAESVLQKNKWNTLISTCSLWKKSEKVTVFASVSCRRLYCLKNSKCFMTECQRRWRNLYGSLLGGLVETIGSMQSNKFKQLAPSCLALLEGLALLVTTKYISVGLVCNLGQLNLHSDEIFSLLTQTQGNTVARWIACPRRLCEID